MPTPNPATAPLRLGVLGCAHIARAFVRDVALCPHVKVVAVASRQADKAAAFASEFGIGRHHASYEALLADPAVDALYLPLPNSLHAEWAIRAAEHGKHVLCEKPLAVNAAQAQAMFDAATRHGVMLLEAYPYWFQPQTRDLLALIHDGSVGSVLSMQASFGFTLARPEGNIRMQPDLGGGALLDTGSYPASLIRLAFGEAPLSVQAESTWADTGVDIATVATLHYTGGRHAQLSCAMNTATHRHALIVGSAGVVETEYLNHTGDGPGTAPWGYAPSQLRVRRGTLNSVPLQTLHSATGSGFAFAAEAFAKVVAERDFTAVARAAQASIDIAFTLEAIALSARENRRVALPPPHGEPAP